MASDTRTKMVASAALLLRRCGISGTSFPKVIEHSSTPRGSIGHHFPGGKREMIADAVRWAGGMATAAMRRAVGRGDPPAELFSQLCGFYRQALVDSEFTAGCPVGVVALEAFDDEPLRMAVDDVFAGWRRVLQQALSDTGHDERAAEDVADLCIAGLEGALMLARIDRSPQPLDRVERRVRALLEERSRERDT
jgi:TetR/AcrR family transcriptional regulator, lmrAB and yxaGH operons repressor